MDDTPTVLESAKPHTLADELKRWIVSVLVLAMGVYFFLNVGHYTLLDNFDLIIHEAGHAIISFLGETIYFLGGTLMQIIVPVLLFAFCFYNTLLKSMQLSLAFLGQNLINISVYAGDASTKKLRLFGPPGAKHDWNFVLSKYGILDWDQDIAMFFLVAAGLVFLFAIILPLLVKD